LTTTSNKKKAKRSPSASAPAPVARKPSSPPPQYVGDSSSSDDEDESTKKKSVVSLGNVVPFERKKQRRQKTDAIDAAADDGDADASPTDGVTDAPPPRSTPRVSLENIRLQAVAQGKPGPCAMEGGIDEDDDVAEVDVEADDLDERSGGGAAAAAANATANATTSATPRDWVASGGATGDFAPCPLGRTTLLFDLNGVLLVNPRDPATGRREPRLRPGVEHLARLCGRFRLGVYSSATLQTVRRATSAVVFGMMAGNGGSQQQQQQQVFELMLCRQHCRPAPQVMEFVFFIVVRHLFARFWLHWMRCCSSCSLRGKSKRGSDLRVRKSRKTVEIRPKPVFSIFLENFHAAFVRSLDAHCSQLSLAGQIETRARAKEVESGEKQ